MRREIGTDGRDSVITHQRQKGKYIEVQKSRWEQEDEKKKVATKKSELVNYKSSGRRRIW
jgi:hypothetical protein